MSKTFKPRERVLVPINGERLEATVIDVLNTQLFVQYDKGNAFVHISETQKLKGSQKT